MDDDERDLSLKAWIANALKEQAEDDLARWQAFEKIHGHITPGQSGNTKPCPKRALKCHLDAVRFQEETEAWRQRLKQQKWW